MKKATVLILQKLKSLLATCVLALSAELLQRIINEAAAWALVLFTLHPAIEPHHVHACMWGMHSITLFDDAHQHPQHLL
jgi:hypothetical protein